MEVLNAAGLTPISVHTNRSPEPRKPLHCRLFKKPISDASPPNFKELLARGFGGGLAVLSSVLGGSGGFAKALTYEEALGQSVGDPTASSGDGAGFDVGGLFDGALNFASENPLVVGGGAVVLAVPLILSQILKDPKAFGVASAASAFSKLSEDEGAELLDIRGAKDLKEGGNPVLRSLKKKVVSIAYKKDQKPGFLKKLSLKFKDPGSTTLYILDKFDGNSELVAELVTANGFKAAFAIKDGAEGARGWKNSGLPWSSPKKTLNIDFGGLPDTITSAFGEGSDSLPATLGLAAATGLGIIAFSEIETVLQLLGSAAIIQLVTKKLLFAEDRKVTLQLVDEFLNTKVAPKELVDEIKMIGKALLPVSPSAVASLPAPAEVNTETSASAEEVKADTVPDIAPEPKVEAAVTPPAVNSVPKAEVSKESIPVLVRSLSPYPYYPDFKPPSSPTPSQP